MLHLLDPEHFRVNTLAATEALIDQIVVPTELQDPANDGIHAISDRIAIFYALAVLFPKAVRDLFMQPYKDGNLSLDQIATYVDLPIFYVVAAMSDHWAVIHGRMIRPQRLLGADRVTLLTANGTVFEVHSVPINDNPYSYARTLLERPTEKMKLMSVSRCVFDMSSGETFELTSAEIIARSSL